MFEQCLYFNSNALARTVTRIWTEEYRQFDLSPPHAFLLRVVLAKPGLLPCELAQELALSRSTITRFLDSLEKRDFLLRKATANDGREVHVYATAKAKKIHHKLNETGKKLTRLMGNIVGKNDLSKVVSDIREIKKILEN